MIHIPHIQIRVVVSLILVVLAGYGYVYLFQHISEKRAELGILESTVETQLQRDAMREELVALESATKADRARLAAHYFSPDDPISFLQLLEELGRDAGVVLEVDSLTEEPASEAGRSAAVRVTVSVGGSFDALYKAIVLLEHMPYALTIEKAAIEQGGESEGGVWNGKIDMRVLTRPQ